jgi:phosphomannomutase
MDVLKFGTDGWRDRIGERFTTANVRRAAQATADVLLQRGASHVIVAHDSRFGGPMFAQAAAETLVANGLHVRLHGGPLPTPVLSFAVTHLQADAGVMLTASHNPPEWNGFKLKGPYGGTATQELYSAVSARTAELRDTDVQAYDAQQAAQVEPLEVRADYYDALTRVLDVDALRRFSGVLVHDAMGGAAGGWVRGFAEHAGLGVRVEDLAGEPKAMFDGRHPEPIPANLGPLTERMKVGDAVLGVATDGDGDRLGAVLPGGRPLTAHEVFALLFDLRAQTGGQGRAIKTFTGARLIDRLAAWHGVPLTETPVGFKYLVAEMLQGGVMIAGEESGGVGVPEHLPERDGILNAWLLAQAAVHASEAGSDTHPGGPLGFRLDAIEEATGWTHRYDRIDMPLGGTHEVAAVTAALAQDPSEFGGEAVPSVERLDGVKLNFSDGAWVLVRASGTEPLLRIYCEAPTTQRVAERLNSMQSFVRQSIRNG